MADRQDVKVIAEKLKLQSTLMNELSIVYERQRTFSISRQFTHATKL
jgi:hypothetical protein